MAGGSRGFWVVCYACCCSALGEICLKSWERPWEAEKPEGTGTSKGRTETCRTERESERTDQEHQTDTVEKDEGTDQEQQTEKSEGTDQEQRTDTVAPPLIEWKSSSEAFQLCRLGVHPGKGTCGLRPSDDDLSFKLGQRDSEAATIRICPEYPRVFEAVHTARSQWAQLLFGAFPQDSGKCALTSLRTFLLTRCWIFLNLSNSFKRCSCAHCIIVRIKRFYPSDMLKTSSKKFRCWTRLLKVSEDLTCGKAVTLEASNPNSANCWLQNLLLGASMPFKVRAGYWAWLYIMYWHVFSIVGMYKSLQPPSMLDKRLHLGRRVTMSHPVA